MGRMKGWIESVPNFSEGRDQRVIERIRQALVAPQGVVLLDKTSDADHNRSVFTLAGPPDAVGAALLGAARVAVDLIDLRKHEGVHPRIGALDVAPLIPLGGGRKDACIALARHLAGELWSQLKLPVYFYGDAALTEARRRLENVRRGQFEGLRKALPGDASRLPDVGGPGLHPSAGATAVGVRKLLIAFNMNLETNDVAVAKEIARDIRESSGGLPFVKALGLALPSRKRTQVSMNLTDFEQTPLHTVFEAVERQAKRLGTSVTSCEIIGLLPRKAMGEAAARFLRIDPAQSHLILENRIEEWWQRR